MLTRKKTPRKRFLSAAAGGHALRADALYGLFYPPNHLRIVGLYGDSADATRAMMLFDRDLAGVPGDVDLWVGLYKGFDPQLPQARVCRFRFNHPLYAGDAWSFSPALGGFTGADGCAGALEVSDLMGVVDGPIPAGKIWLDYISWVDAGHLDFTFSAAVTVGGGSPGGFWCVGELGNPLYGGSAVQQDASTARVAFAGTVSPWGRGGLLAGFDDVAEAANVPSPVTVRM